jgi:hypothetical protein
MWRQRAAIQAKIIRTGPDWRACVEVFDDKHLERLADWRGSPASFARGLNGMGLLGCMRSASPSCA